MNDWTRTKIPEVCWSRAYIFVTKIYLKPRRLQAITPVIKKKMKNKGTPQNKIIWLIKKRFDVRHHFTSVIEKNKNLISLDQPAEMGTERNQAKTNQKNATVCDAWKRSKEANCYWHFRPVPKPKITQQIGIDLIYKITTTPTVLIVQTIEMDISPDY